MPTRRALRLFEEYAQSHRNPLNLRVHWIAVPVIFFSTLGLLHAVPGMDASVYGIVQVIDLVLAAVLLYYASLSVGLAIGMGLFIVLCEWLIGELRFHAPWPLWAICSVLFAGAWTAQFLGHRVEGRKPSFLKDVQFLLVGPAWLLAKLYSRTGIPY